MGDQAVGSLKDVHGGGLGGGGDEENVGEDSELHFECVLGKKTVVSCGLGDGGVVGTWRALRVGKDWRELERLDGETKLDLSAATLLLLY